MSVRAVVFDIGGVLEVAPGTSWVAAWEARLGMGRGELAERARDVWRAGAVGGISEEEVGRRLGERLGLERARVDALLEDAWREYLGELDGELAAYFAGLRPRYRTALLSNSFVGARAREEARYGLGATCDLIIYSHEVGMEKPDRRIYELTCARLGVGAGEAVFVEDSERNVEAAREVGMRAVLFRCTAQAIPEIEACLRGYGGRGDGGRGA